MSESETPASAPWPPTLPRPVVYIMSEIGTIPAALIGVVDADTSGHFYGLVYDKQYGDMLGTEVAKVWPTSGDLILIDQDTQVAPGMILHLAQCPEPWCRAPHNSVDGLDTYGLGFTKFSKTLMTKYPTLAGRAGITAMHGTEQHTPDTLLGARFEAELQQLGVAVHHHTDGPRAAAAHG